MTYYHPRGKNWLATVTNLDGVSTGAPNFRQLDFYVREAIELAEGLPDGTEDKLEITWHMTDGCHRPFTSPWLKG